MVRYFAAIGLAMGIATLGCSKEEPAPKSSTEQTEANSLTVKLPIEQVMTEFTDSLMSFPGVVGVGVGDSAGKPCIAVLVVEKTTDLEAQVPKQLGGYPVRIDETGDFRPDDDSIPPGD